MKSSSTIEQRALTNEESKKLSAASIHAILCLARWNNLRLKAFHLRFHLLLAVARDNFALSLSSALLLCRWISFEIHEAPSRKGSCEFNSSSGDTAICAGVMFMWYLQKLGTFTSALSTTVKSPESLHLNFCLFILFILFRYYFLFICVAFNMNNIAETDCM